ncbi:MAG: hypothetical protein U9N11_05535 [Campylobacterota bacterium]|nr:hypothetical protein [Campylobacterota bacterium]
MQTIYIDVKDLYVPNVLKMLHGMKDVMIDKIKVESQEVDENTETLMMMQTQSLEETWDNDEDKAWDAL